jgi:predicted permease
MIPRRMTDVLRHRLRSLFRRPRVESDLDRELSFHLEQQILENLAAGMSPDEARAAAHRALGGLMQIQEECRDTRRVGFLETLARDLHFAARLLARTPGFTVIIVLTMALAIGANSAIFSVVEGVLLKPLPYAHPDRLVRIYFQNDAQPKFPMNPFDFLDFRARNRAFSSLAAMVRSDVQLSQDNTDPVLLRGFQISAAYFRTLGLRPARGREFTTRDEQPGQPPVAILSDHLWRTRFKSNPATLGSSIRLNGQLFTVAGIMPPGTHHPGNNYHSVADGETVDIWIPFVFNGNPARRGSHYLDIIGRLRPGITFEQGNADLRSVLAQMAKENTGTGWRTYLIPLYSETVGASRRMLLVLLGAVGLLLLIACVNAANLLLARSSARAREIAVRSALGAARSRIIRQLLTESVLIASLGAALGTVLAVIGVRVLVALLPPGFPRSSEIHLDAGVFAFTVAAAFLTGILFGFIPALVASGHDLQQNLRESSRGLSSGARQALLRNGLVIGEVGLACVLLIGAGLMLNSFVRLLNSDRGFRPENVLTASISLSSVQYNDSAIRRQFFTQLTAGISNIPGVLAVGAGSDLPWTGWDENNDGFTVEGKSAEFNNATIGRYHMATPGYFAALGVPLLDGRLFDQRDEDKSPGVLIVNRSFASRYWPGESAVGKRISFRDVPKEDKDWMRIIGVVGDIKDKPEQTSTRPAFWYAYPQVPVRVMSLVVRSSLDPAQLTGNVRALTRQLDPALALADVRVLDDVADEALSTHRFALFLIGLFALLAFGLAAIGIYGVISYSVSQRMREFGMRMALGARPSDLIRLIVGQGLWLATAGVIAGLLAAAAFTRAIRSLLYETSSFDPATFAAVGAIAIATALLASWLPARRATGADPMTILRSE